MFPRARQIPAVIFRLKTDDEGIIVPGTEYLVRHEEALFEQAEWSWDGDIDQAYQFDDLRLAEEHMKGLKEQGVKHVHTMPFGTDHRRAQEVRRREGKAPEQVYAEASRRLGERE